MIKPIKYLLFVAIISIVFSTSAHSQNDTIFRALKDELNRNMEELGKGEEYKSPFYMRFVLNDCELQIVTASLGSVLYQKTKNNRTKWTDILIGGYELSNENFSDRSGAINHNDGDIPLPLENDYISLRRAYWLQINNTYKNVWELYKKKMDALKLKGLTVNDLPAPDFSKETPVIFLKPAPNNDYDAKKIQKMAGDFSKIFINYPDILNPVVHIIHVTSTENSVNSEGTQLCIPFSMYIVLVNAGIYNEDQLIETQRITYFTKSFDELPDNKTIENDINNLVKNLQLTAKAERFSENYIGPVMLESNAVAELGFMNLFMSGTESLLGMRIPLMNDNNNELVIPNIQTWDNNFGKKVIDNKISIYDISTTPNFKGKPLLGHFEMDLYGVKPSDTLTLIEKGILKSQLTSRIPTKNQHRSTGHFRIGTDLQGVTAKLSPGVVLIKSNEKISKSEIQNKIIEKGNEENLPFVIVAKTMESSANVGPVNFYKINTTSGEATLLRGVQFKSKVNDLRKIEYVSDNDMVYNTMFLNQRPDFLRGIPTSFIMPDAVIIEETQIVGNLNSIKGELPVVPSPLQMNSQF